MDGIGPALCGGNKYLVKEYVSLEDLEVVRKINGGFTNGKDTDNADMVILENGGGWSAKDSLADASGLTPDFYNSRLTKARLLHCLVS